MRKLLVVFPLLLVLVGGCDSTRRDFGVCDTTYSSCLKGFTCDFNRGLCVPDVDGGALDSKCRSAIAGNKVTTATPTWGLTTV